MIFILPFPLLAYVYRIVYGVMTIVTWIERGTEVMEIVFYDVVSFFELVSPENNNYEAHLISWIA